ncbi:Alpha/Beta hydrolase protein [Syncephalis plumigaleata]|nr:Alpha/Beta hydrolase protein [Syncephalis plumigaleata]
MTTSTVAAASINAKVSLARRAPSMFDSMWKHLLSTTCRLHRFGATAGYAYNRLWKSSSNAAGSPIDVANAYANLTSVIKGEADVLAPQPTVEKSAALDDKVNVLATLPLLYRYAFYSAATYCENGDVVKKLTGVKLQEDTLAIPLTGATITHWYDIDSVGHYVAVNEQQKAVVLAFRGSNNNRNFLDAADVTETSPDPVLYNVPANDTANDIPPMKSGTQSNRNGGESVDDRLPSAHRLLVIITGHSLGGAVAQLAALHARVKYRTELPLTAVYTYGKPIIGNALFEDWSVDVIQPTPFLRFVSSNDVVPNLWYDNNARKKIESRVRHATGAKEIYCPDPASPKMVICKNETDSECSEMQVCTQLSWEHHSEYAGFRATKSVCLLAEFSKN